jgi:hypothetical protein
MKKLLSCLLAATLILGLPSLAMAKKDKGLSVRGKVTAVTATSITVKPGKKVGGDPQTITVPEGTPITVKDGSPAPALADLVGKRVKVKESVAGTAKAIVLKKLKGGKKKNA